jgi:hypothetical protein
LGSPVFRDTVVVPADPRRPSSRLVVATKVDTPLVGRSSATGGDQIRPTNVAEADARLCGRSARARAAAGRVVGSVPCFRNRYAHAAVVTAGWRLTGLALVAFRPGSLRFCRFIA